MGGPGKYLMVIAGALTGATCWLHTSLPPSMPAAERDIHEEALGVPQFSLMASEEMELMEADVANMAVEELNENEEDDDPDKVSYLRTRRGVKQGSTTEGSLSSSDE